MILNYKFKLLIVFVNVEYLLISSYIWNFLRVYKVHVEKCVIMFKITITHHVTHNYVKITITNNVTQ